MRDAWAARIHVRGAAIKRCAWPEISSMPWPLPMMATSRVSRIGQVSLGSNGFEQVDADAVGSTVGLTDGCGLSGGSRQCHRTRHHVQNPSSLSHQDLDKNIMCSKKCNK